MTLADPPFPPFYGIFHNFIKKIFEPFPYNAFKLLLWFNFINNVFTKKIVKSRTN